MPLLPFLLCVRSSLPPGRDVVTSRISHKDIVPINTGMFSFGQFLIEDNRYDITVELLKVAKVHPHTEDGKAAQTMADRRLAKMSPAEADKARKEVAAWEPGGCTNCNGMGLDQRNRQCYVCGGTGLQGMTDVQSKWYMKIWSTLEKSHDAINKADHGYHEMRRQFGVEHPHQLPDTKIFKDIVTAAKRSGVHVPNDFFDFNADDEKDQGLTSEYYQGHEFDYYLNAVEGLMWQLSKAIAKKHGWKETITHNA